MAYPETSVPFCGESSPDHSCRASLDHPFHYSVGAVLFNDRRQFGVLYSPATFYNPWGFTDFDQLMRETPEVGEDDAEAVMRGAMEEFGASATIQQKLGSLSVEVAFSNFDAWYRKTTQYYLCKVDDIDESRREPGFDGLEGAEGSLTALWLPSDQVLARQEKQLPRMRDYNRLDLYEAPVISEANQALHALSPTTIIDLGAY